MSSPPIDISRSITPRLGDISIASSSNSHYDSDTRSPPSRDSEARSPPSHDSDARSPPAHERTSLHHLTLRKKTSYRKAICGTHSHLKHPEYRKRELRSTIDWTEYAIPGDHVWLDTSESGDFCYANEAKCTQRGSRKKCACCKIAAHSVCAEQMTLSCKPSFREACLRSYRENTFMRHHWVHRLRENGRCKQCLKAFPQKFSFKYKEFMAISCSWCKEAYHTEGCFSMDRIEENCSLGQHRNIIVPPHWIIKLAKKGSFRSSVKKRRHSSTRRRDNSLSRDDSIVSISRPFIVKPMPTPNAQPLLVFINPRSGGNQGSHLMHRLQWLLNPRQVFDLSENGPRAGLELFAKVPNLRVLACGGDGTVGWILSVIDSLNIKPHPPVAVLPLGTGNDLSRTLNWGGGYTDEPLEKILCAVEEGSTVQLDRWSLNVSRYAGSLSSISDATSIDESVTESLPLQVMNNYFSLGADAHVTLEFHESREANPEKFSSRFWNKMYYAGVGGKDILKRTWKDLSEHVTLECDSVEYTSKIREMKFHCLLFLNIPKYAAGTTPWGSSIGPCGPQRHDDGFLEVIGFTTASLAGLQLGAHGGVRLTQCEVARLTTTKPIPVQVDGEPCRLQPSEITIYRRNQACMVQRPKRGLNLLSPGVSDVTGQHPSASSRQLCCNVYCVSVADYETLHYDKKKLEEKSKLVGNITVDYNVDLIHVRAIVDKLIDDSCQGRTADSICPSANWSFVDTATAERFFRIDRGQEHFHYATDIFSSDLFIVCPVVTSDQTDSQTNQLPSSTVRPYKPPNTQPAGPQLPNTQPAGPQLPNTQPAGPQPPNTQPVVSLAAGPQPPTDSISPDVRQHSVGKISGRGVKVELCGLEGSGSGLSRKQGPIWYAVDMLASRPLVTSTTASTTASAARELSVPTGSSVASSAGAEMPIMRDDRRWSHPAHRSAYSTEQLLQDADVSPTNRRHRPLQRINAAKRKSDSFHLSDSETTSELNPLSEFTGINQQPSAINEKLIRACQIGDINTLMEIMSRGADVSYVDRFGLTALHHAAICGKTEIVDYLIKKISVPVKLLDLVDHRKGQTALHKAAIRSHDEICYLLVSAGASVTVKDFEGLTASELAQSAGYEQLTKFLKQQSSCDQSAPKLAHETDL